MILDVDGDGEAPSALAERVPDGAIVRVQFTDTSSGYENEVLRALGHASYLDSRKTRTVAAAPRARVEMPTEAGIVPRTRTWLTLNGLPEEPYISAATKLVRGS